MPEYGLGRLPAADPRDRLFLMSAPSVPPTRTSRSWYDLGWWGDQGARPYCVGYSWAHFIEDSPQTHPDPGKSAWVQPDEIYHAAQLIDEWPGENYDGTSVRAGAKYLHQAGYIKEYRWAFDPTTVAHNVLEVGPVVVGTNWYSSMFNPDPKGRLSLTGSVVGGHAYLINGYNRKTKLFRIKNSWGRAWGVNGRALLHFDDLAQLLAEDGEACMAVE
jgi:hypothetical protein